MDMPLKAPIPAATGKGASDKMYNSNKSISNKQSIYNPPSQDFVDKKINDMSAASPIMERMIERALAYCLITMPGETIRVVLERKIEPENDQEVVTFFNRIRPKYSEIVKLGNDEAVAFVYNNTDYQFYWKCKDAREYFFYDSVDTILDDLIAVRAERKASIHIIKRKLIDRVFGGWVDL